MKKLTVLAAALAVAPLATAQVRPEISVGYDVNVAEGAPSVGIGFRQALASLPITLAPHGDFYITDKGTALQANVDGLYSFPGTSFSPYIGLGIGASYEKGKEGTENRVGGTSSGAYILDTEGKIRPGVNFVFGGTMNGATVRPYAQLRLSTGTVAGAGISAGLVF